MVSLQGVSASALADARGAWRCELPPLAASDFETLVVQGADERIEVRDVAVGEELDIHPKNKLVPGYRLALLALRHLFGRDVLADAPRCTGTVLDGRTIVLGFDNVGEGLAVVGEAVNALEVVAIIAFTLAFGSTAGSTMWTAVDGIDSIQEECGLALGFTRQESFREIIFPQAAQIFLPQLVGQFVSLVKDTAVVGYIAVQDLTRASDLIRARTMDAFFPLLATAVIYFLFCRMLAWALGKLVVRLDVRSRPREIEGAES